MKYKGILVEGSSSRCSLSKLVGKSIKDIHGVISIELGDPAFKPIAIVFDDGSTLRVEGEHDFPYVVGNQPNYDDETLRSLFEDSKND